MRVPIVIPAYEPDHNLIKLCDSLIAEGLTDIVVIDDGSGDEYKAIFGELIGKRDIVLLRHYVNLGKGRALKDVFNYLLNDWNVIGCVTADSDGQHTAKDISKCINKLIEAPDKLILGCRNFDLEHIPVKSAFGNKLTRKICKWLCDIDVSDTQTGLRAIPRDYMAYLLNTKGERFEFETNMLVESHDRIQIIEIPIETIYDSKTEHKTHFDPIKDSIVIYKIFVGIFLKFIISSLSSSVLDLLLFYFLCVALKAMHFGLYIAVSTIIARIVSATYNYLVNYNFVFNSKKKKTIAFSRYAILAIVQMSLSAVLVSIGVLLFTFVPELFVKMVVDTVLFVVSYKIQQRLVF